MLKEIGSNFWLKSDSFKNGTFSDAMLNVPYEDIAFLSSGRGAMSLILSEIESKNKRALIPCFTCESVIEPFLKNGYDVDYYLLDNNLCISKEEFLKQVFDYSPDLVLVHSYYGFDNLSGIHGVLGDLRRKGIIVIEDITQSLYSCYERTDADYYVGSFRKWAGIPDGGFATKSTGSFKKKPVNEDLLLVEMKVNAMIAKYDYLFHDKGDKSSYLKMYSNAEELLENEDILFRMSDFSMGIQSNLNVTELKMKRRENYRILLDSISCNRVNSLFSLLPDNVVPLYFPLICDNERNGLQKHLCEHQIYAPIIWPQSQYITSVSEDASVLYKNLLCIPCDQRYGEAEMERIALVINDWC